MRQLLLLVLAGTVAVAACGDEDRDGNANAGDQGRRQTAGTPARSASASPAKWPAAAPFEPVRAEAYPNAKRLAGRVAARAVTYPRGASARGVAKRIGPSAVGPTALASAIKPVLDGEMGSTGSVVYPQLSGVTPRSFGAMVVVRQRLQDAGGERRTLTRVIDVRLRRAGGPWRLDRIASLGGRPVARPRKLSAAARRVVSDPRITLSDSARWDIYRGVDDGLLATLGRLAERHRFSISVLRTGHPRTVWMTSRPSAHSRGYAADIYAVDGQLVVRRAKPGGPARALAAALVSAGAAQVGSPWVLGPGGRRSFSDPVHQDHIHVQWSTMP